MLEVRYQNTVEDLRSAIRAMPWRVRLAVSVALWSLLAISGLAATLLLYTLDIWYALAAGWILFGLLGLYIENAAWASHRSTLRAVEQRLRPTTTRISPERLESQTERGWTRADWLSVDRIVVTASHILLLNHDQTLHLIPRRAFDSPAQADDFASAAREYHRGAQQLGTARFTPSTPAAPVDGDTRQVSFRNSAAEFVSLQFDGLPKKDQPRRKRLSWRGALFLIGLGLFFAHMASGGDLVERTILGLLAFLLLALAVLVLSLRLLQRVVRRAYRKMSEGERTVSISSEGVSAVGALSQSFGMWEEYSSIEDDARFVVFFQNERTHVAHLIPKPAFATADDASRFMNLALRYWEKAHPAPLLAALVETGNPYQSPLAS